MTWLFVIAFFAVAFWFVRRAVERAAEFYGAGLERSPLYWVTSLLTFALLGLAMHMAHAHKQGPVPSWLWLVSAALVVVILLLRRALKWRYPI
jgi:cytochrome bd-type quinol oxidase subunit 2